MLLGQPRPALRQPLGMRQHALDLGQVGGAREQLLGDLQCQLAADLQLGESTSRSRVTFTAPSVVFSTGTTPNCARPRSTSSKISAIVRDGW